MGEDECDDSQEASFYVRVLCSPEELGPRNQKKRKNTHKMSRGGIGRFLLGFVYGFFSWVWESTIGWGVLGQGWGFGAAEESPKGAQDVAARQMDEAFCHVVGALTACGHGHGDQGVGV